MEHMAEKLEMLQVDMAQHKAQDESMYKQLDDVKSAVGDTNKLLQAFGVRLGDYNKQLAVHIANNVELKEQTKLLGEGMKKMYEGIDERLQKVEAPHKWAAITYHFLKMFSYASLFVSAIYGLIRFLETHKPF